MQEVRVLERKPLFWAVSFGHLTVDMFNGMVAVLMVFISSHVIPLSNTQIGLAVSAYQLGAALAQPVFGILSDRNGGRLLGAGGVGWTVGLLLVAMLIGQVTGIFWLMLPLLMLASLGSSAFHPVGAMHAAENDPSRTASNTAIFFMSGQIGLAIGPALAGLLLDRAATHNNVLTEGLGPLFAGTLLETGTVLPVFMLALIAIPAVVAMALTMPGARAHRVLRQQTMETQAVAVAGALPVRALVLLAVVVALRSLVNPGTVTFIPRLFELKGWSPVEYGFVTSLFWLGGGVAGVLIGMLADRWDSRHLIAVTMVASAPALFLLAALDGGLALLMALLFGAFSGSSHSLIVVQAQALLPGRKGLASGAILGYMFATGAIGSLIIGAISDTIGLTTAFTIVAVIAVISGLLSLGVRAERRPVQVIAAPVETAASAGD
jgi:FSR family fosmidomycin resistance protein-like MFS transporter